MSVTLFDSSRLPVASGDWYLVRRVAGHRVTVLLDLSGRQPGVIMADHHREVLAA